MAYPTGDDLQAFMVQAGMVAANTNEALDYSGYIDSAVAQWERDTGYYPFLNIGTEEVRVFDCPDSYILAFDGGMIEMQDPDNFTVDTRILTAGIDYDFYPYNAPNKGKPYTAVKFRYILRAYPYIQADIRIRANWGYTYSLPADVKQALLSHAACNLMASSAYATGFVNMVKQDDVTIGYASTGSNAIMNAQQNQLINFYKDTLKRYKKTRLF